MTLDFMDVVGVVALLALWFNTLLIVGHAGIERRQLAQRALRLSGVQQGKVGSDGPLAEARVVQLGRSKGDNVIHFHDRDYQSRSLGGHLTLADGSQLPVTASEPLEVWPDPSAIRDASACPDHGAFEELYARAVKARGVERTVVQALEPGQPAWLVPADASGPLWISAIDPGGWIARRRLLLLAFMAGCILACAGCTTLALWPPVYGSISTLGGLACLAFFLLVQPLGASLSERVLPLHRAVLRGSWSKP